MPSFTVGSQNLQSVGPVVEVALAISNPLEKTLKSRDMPVPPPVTVQALVDTGAYGTVVQSGIPDQLSLKPVGQVRINTPTSTNVACLTYHMRIVFPNNIAVDGITVIEAPVQGQAIRCLIGRDILAKSVLI